MSPRRRGGEHTVVTLTCAGVSMQMSQQGQVYTGTSRVHFAPVGTGRYVWHGRQKGADFKDRREGETLQTLVEENICASLSRPQKVHLFDG